MYNNDFRDTSSSERQKIVSARSYSRVVPSAMLQPYLSVAPVQTKFSVLPLIDPRKQVTAQLEQLPTYNIRDTFNPGNDMGPWSGYASSVNTESELRNQLFALQKSSQAVYVPSSKSDLYNVQFQSKAVAQPHADLFNSYVPAQVQAQAPMQPNQKAQPPKYSNKMGQELFNNSTRTQREDAD
jgi:hypothetical protein